MLPEILMMVVSIAPQVVDQPAAENRKHYTLTLEGQSVGCTMIRREEPTKGTYRVIHLIDDPATGRRVTSFLGLEILTRTRVLTVVVSAGAREIVKFEKSYHTDQPVRDVVDLVPWADEEAEGEIAIRVNGREWTRDRGDLEETKESAWTEEVDEAIQRLSSLVSHRGTWFPIPEFCSTGMPTFIREGCPTDWIPPDWQRHDWPDCSFDESFGFPCENVNAGRELDGLPVNPSAIPRQLSSDRTPCAVPDTWTVVLLAERYPDSAVENLMAVRAGSRRVVFNAISRGYCPQNILFQVLVATHEAKLKTVSALAECLMSLEGTGLTSPAAVEVEFRFTTGESAGGLVLSAENARRIVEGSVSVETFFAESLRSSPVPSP